MAWTQSTSASFLARHDSRQRDAALTLLDDLEHTRARIQRVLGDTPGEIAVVIHDSPLALVLASPWLPLARYRAAPAARRYYASSFAQATIHVLTPAALERRASQAPGSREALRRCARHAYAQLAIVGAARVALPPPFGARRLARYLRLAWLCEGGATYLAGQVGHLDAAIVRRLREGGRPAFPPSARDALLLGGTLFALLESVGGASACGQLITEVDDRRPASALEAAFGQPLAQVERTWREWLDDLTSR